MNALSRVSQWPLAPSLWRFFLRWRFRLFQHHRHGRLVLEYVAGRPFVVLPSVFNPKLFRTGEFLANRLDATLIPPGSSVLELGTGSGVVAVVAAHWARRVIAVDINPEAVRCARINALVNRVEDRVEVRTGDLFAPVRGERFDRVVFNPPYYQGTPRDAADHAWRGVAMAERFAAGLADSLRPGGQALIQLSTDADESLFTKALESHRFLIERIAERHLVNETLRIYRASHADSL